MTPEQFEKLSKRYLRDDSYFWSQKVRSDFIGLDNMADEIDEELRRK